MQETKTLTRPGIYAGLALVTLLIATVGVAMPIVEGMLLNAIAPSVSGAVEPAWGLLAFWGALFVAPVVLHIVRWRFEMGARQRLLLKARVEVSEKLSRLSYATHESQSFQEELRFINQNGHRNWQFWYSVFQLFGATVSATLAAIGLAYFSWLALVVLLAVTVPNFLVTRYVAGKWFETEEGLRSSEHRGGYLSNLFTRVESVGLVKLFRIEAMILASMWELTSAGLRGRLKMATRDAVLRILAALVLQAGLLAILCATFYVVTTRDRQVAAWLLNPRIEVTVGLWATMGGLCGAVLGSVSHAVSELGSLSENGPYLKRRKALLALPEEDEGTEPAQIRSGKLIIDLHDVGFRYPNSETWALRHVNLRICSGERIALLGDNGSGKSTLFKLLSGLYRPTEGRILVNGRDLATVSRDEYYGLMGFLLQEQELLEAMTVAQLVSGRREIDADTLARVRRACEITGADEFIGKLPQGYDTLVGRWFGGAHFSGGQRQRLALATVLCRQPLIALLDEPTSAIDFGGKLRIKEALRAHPMWSGYVIAAHEPIVLDLTERVIVIQEGRVVSDTTWSEATEGSPYLRAMYTEYRSALRL